VHISILRVSYRLEPIEVGGIESTSDTIGWGG
jgi:hypothetical protein